jgi:hypothetical protein
MEMDETEVAAVGALRRTEDELRNTSIGPNWLLTTGGHAKPKEGLAQG